MKAKCPYCKTGCEKCKDGYFEATMAKGTCFTRVCQNRAECGFVNGGYITEAGFPEESSEECVCCGGPTDWLPLSEAPTERPWAEPKNDLKWTIKRHEEVVESFNKHIDFLQKFALTLIPSDYELTVEQARFLDVCRICHKPQTAPFILNYGKEFAHESCLEG